MPKETNVAKTGNGEWESESGNKCSEVTCLRIQNGGQRITKGLRKRTIWLEEGSKKRYNLGKCEEVLQLQKCVSTG